MSWTPLPCCVELPITLLVLALTLELIHALPRTKNHLLGKCKGSAFPRSPDDSRSRVCITIFFRFPLPACSSGPGVGPLWGFLPLLSQCPASLAGFSGKGFRSGLACSHKGPFVSRRSSAPCLSFHPGAIMCTVI